MPCGAALVSPAVSVACQSEAFHRVVAGGSGCGATAFAALRTTPQPATAPSSPTKPTRMRHSTEDNNTTRFNRGYFDRWYRHPARRLKSPAELRREVEFVLRATEHILGRPVRSVLDVGCGEGNWYPVLTGLRPTLRYSGIDPSEYVVRRWGARRNIKRGSVDTLATLGVAGPYDLVICCGVLNYLDAATLARGLRQIAEVLGGAAYLEMYTAGDAVTGDTRAAKRRAPSWYREKIRRAGLIPCGMHLYVTRALARDLATLEQLPRRASRRPTRGAPEKSRSRQRVRSVADA
jgi:SAM-dependent methyltransferase